MHNTNNTKKDMYIIYIRGDPIAHLYMYVGVNGQNNWGERQTVEGKKMDCEKGTKDTQTKKSVANGGMESGETETYLSY